MGGSVNKVILIGNVGADPEIRRTQAGKPIVNLRIATSESWRDANGDRKEKTEWHSVVCFSEGLCKVIEQYVKKGSKLYVEGALATRKWQDQSGNDRYSTEITIQGYNGKIEMLDSPSSGSDRQSGYAESSGRARREPEQTNSYGDIPDDSDLPF